MTSPLSVALIGLAGAAIAALLNYVAQSRRASGRIASSEASDLWEESKAIRDDYGRRLESALGRIAALEGRVAESERRNVELERENVHLEAQLLDAQRTIEELRGELAQCRIELGDVRRENESLRSTIRKAAIDDPPR